METPKETADQIESPNSCLKDSEQFESLNSFLRREKVEDQWVVLVQGKINQQRTSRDQSSRGCIFKVAPGIRRAKPEGFTPVLVHLGPYHAKHPEHQPSIGDELKYRVASLVEDEVFKSFVDRIRNEEDEVRNYYGGQLHIQSSQCLAFSLALDALFIASLLLDWSRDDLFSKSLEGKRLASLLQPALVGLTQSHRWDGCRDILLLENQLPLFLLRYATETLLRSVLDPRQLITERELYKQFLPKFALLVVKTASPFQCHRAYCHEDDVEVKVQEKTQRHLLEFLYKLCTSGHMQEEISQNTCARDTVRILKSYIYSAIGKNILRAWAKIRGKESQSQEREKQKQRERENFLSHSQADTLTQTEPQEKPLKPGPKPKKSVHISSAWYLRRAGIKFKGDPTNCTGVYFDKGTGTLHLPTICIQDITDSIVRNLIAYEQHTESPGTPSIFFPYVHFMDYLIDTPKDVDELVKNGVLISEIGSHEEVARTWNHFCDGVILDVQLWSPRSPFYEVTRNIQNYCSQRRHKWLADWKTYLDNNPWLVVSIVVGAILLVLTFLQTYYSIVAYYHH